jgi:hypothetical protein
MKKNLCSITICKELEKLGFNGRTLYYYSYYRAEVRKDPNLQPRDWNHYFRPRFNWISVPTVDEAIDWIRRKYDVIIYNHIPPFVDPKDKQNRIVYIYDVKFCNRRDGWNGRVTISTGRMSYNIYAVKRMAIMDAIRWIKKNRICSKKTKK